MSIVSTDRYRIIREQQSEDKGQTWVDTGNIYYSDVEKNSEYCGYIPSADFKATLYYRKYNSGATIFTYDVPWNRNTIFHKSDITGTTEFFYLDKVVLNEGVTTIDIGAFNSTETLGPVTIEVFVPDSLRTIGNYAFRSGSLKNTSRIFTPYLETINDSAFTTCSFDSPIDITIPDSITTIGFRAFTFSNMFNKVTYGNGLTEAIGFNGSRVQEVVFSEAITSIGLEAFSGCTGLTSITFESSSIHIGQYGFYGCSNLSTITTHASIAYSYPNSFTNLPSSGTLYYAQNVDVDTWRNVLPQWWNFVPIT